MPQQLWSDLAENLNRDTNNTKAMDTFYLWNIHGSCEICTRRYLLESRVSDNLVIM